MQSVELKEQQICGDKWHLAKHFDASQHCENSVYCIENGINGMASLFPLSAYCRFRNYPQLPEMLIRNNSLKWVYAEDALKEYSQYESYIEKFPATTPVLIVKKNTKLENVAVIEFPCSIESGEVFQNYIVIIEENSCVNIVETLNFNHITNELSPQKPQSSLWIIKSNSTSSRSIAYTTCCPINNKSDAVIEENSMFASTILKIGKGNFYKTIQNINLVGKNAVVEYAECFIGEREQCSESHIKVNHLAPNTASNIDVRSVLTQSSKIAFDCNVIIAEKATNAKSCQNNSNFICSEGATAISVPNMDIHNKNVEASHSTGSKHIDEEAVFYLQTRGVCKKIAHEMLIQGFLSSLFDKTQETLSSVCLERLKNVIG